MIGIASGLALAGVLVGGYQLSCAGASCAVQSPQLSFRVERVGESLVIRPISVLVQGSHNHGAGDWINRTTQYLIVPDYCQPSTDRCHYVVGPETEVVKWSQRADSANRISTRIALTELARARGLSILTSHADEDVVSWVGPDVPAAEFVAAVRAAEAQLRANH
jgi:hypothetical protein